MVGTIPEGRGGPALKVPGEGKVGVLSLFFCLPPFPFPIVFLHFAGNSESFRSRKIMGSGDAQAWWTEGERTG